MEEDPTDRQAVPQPELEETLSPLAHDAAAEQGATLPEASKGPGLLRRLGHSAVKKFGRTPSLELPGDEVLEIVESFESQRFVREAPKIHELASDTSRTNPFTYWVHDASTRTLQASGHTGDLSSRTMTEHEGLQGLINFLDDSAAIEAPLRDGSVPQETIADAATTIKEETHFIGEAEISEATAGFAELWKAYLRENPKHRLLIPQELVRTNEAGMKSSEYLFGRVMAHFTEEELIAYRGRIHTHMHELKPRHTQDTKIILLDDWSISGTQLKNGLVDTRHDFYKAFNHDPENPPEVHLVAASTEQIESASIRGEPASVFAYFRAGHATSGESWRNGPRVTGIHSSVDFEFESTIEEIVVARNKHDPSQRVTMPPLTNIEKPYVTY